MSDDIQIYWHNGEDLPDGWATVFTVDEIKPLLPAEREKDPRVKLSAVVMTTILNNVANTGVLYRSCIAAGVSHMSIHRLRKKVPVIDELVEIALDAYRERLSHTIHSRAVDGWEEPVFYQGEECGTVRKYSDRLLELHAKRHIPEYRDKSTIDVNATAGVLVVSTPSQDKEAWLAEMRKRRSVESTVVD